MGTPRRRQWSHADGVVLVPWRDDERAGVLVFDEPVVVHSYTVPAAIEDDDNLGRLAAFCRRMCRDANQREVGLVIADEYFAIIDEEHSP